MHTQYADTVMGVCVPVHVGGGVPHAQVEIVSAVLFCDCPDVDCN